ncbi:MAG: GNAT family N-acetyltransferase [Mucispirillum sp.]|nr:GNAT family N-acetyltransferase [Mucispirillum sp.]
MIITNASIDDLDSVTEIYRNALEHDAHLHAPEIIAFNMDKLKKDIQTGDFLKAMDANGDVAGFICGKKEADTLVIEYVVVREADRNGGIGRKLIFALEHLYIGARSVVITTPSNNPKNTAFYESMGYVKLKEEPSEHGYPVVFFEKLKR